MARVHVPGRVRGFGKITSRRKQGSKKRAVGAKVRTTPSGTGSTRVLSGGGSATRALKTRKIKVSGGGGGQHRDSKGRFA